MIKTSISHPLRIDEVKIPNGTGIIGMTLCPGKKISSATSGVRDRIQRETEETGRGFIPIIVGRERSGSIAVKGSRDVADCF